MSSLTTAVSGPETGILPGVRPDGPSEAIPAALPTTIAMSTAPEDSAEPAASACTCTGQVKWFNDQKGFGFICDEDGRDVFVHYAVIESKGFKTLSDGETVRYEFVDGPKGRRATKVIRSHGPLKGNGDY